MIQVGGVIGAIPTIGLVVLTAVIGSVMLRQQGFATLRKAQDSLDRGIPPAEALIEGVFLIVGGALLLTPGFFTDAVGFMCLLPAGRKWFVVQAMKRMDVVQVHLRRGQSESSPAGTTTIEGEYRREDD